MRCAGAFCVAGGSLCAGVGKEEVSAEVSVAYVGDHLHGDVLAAHSRGWHAIAIVGALRTWWCRSLHIWQYGQPLPLVMH